MNLIKTRLPGVLIIEPRIFGDARGFFLETWNCERYRAAGFPDVAFVQDNHSRSQKGVLRGLHFQLNHPQGKLVQVTTGAVFDVAVELCPESPVYRQWVGTELSGENHRQLWIPPGYAHGFCVLSDVADFQYKCTEFYYPEDESGVLWNDPDIGIDWPVREPLLSHKDAALPGLADISREQLLKLKMA